MNGQDVSSPTTFQSVPNWFSSTSSDVEQTSELEQPRGEELDSQSESSEASHSLAKWTKKALYDRAKQLEISGRSKMAKQELISALLEFPPGDLEASQQPQAPSSKGNQLDAQKHRERLRKIREELVAELQHSAQAINQDILAPGDLEGPPTHPGDLDSEGIDREVVLAHTEKSQIDQIDAALERIANGTYGKCEKCGKSIAEIRLDALPYTAYCSDCALRDDSTRREETG